MGNRAWIEVSAEQFETPISFYGHWSGEDNLTAVRKTLEISTRIGDVSYLTAQIFYNFTQLGRYTGDTGFGIFSGVSPATDDVDTVYVNADTGAYTYQGITYDEYTRVKV